MPDEFKKRWITLAFPRELDHSQENILIRNLQLIPATTKEELEKIHNKLGKKRFSYLERVPGVKEALEFIKARMLTLTAHMDDYFILTRTDKKTFHFGYAYEDLKTLNAQVSVLGRTLHLPEPCLANEGKLVGGLKRYIFPDMGFKAEDVVITISDKMPVGLA